MSSADRAIAYTDRELARRKLRRLERYLARTDLSPTVRAVAQAERAEQFAEVVAVTILLAIDGVETARAAAPLPFFSREELREMELDREAAMDAFSAPRLPGEFI